MPVNTYWTLTDNNGVEKTLADWGIEHGRISKKSQTVDEMTFNLTGIDVDSPQPFSYRSQCIIQSGRVLNADGTFSGGAQRFVGIVTSIPTEATGGAEGISYRLAGPMWWLEEKTYAQIYNVITGGTFAHPVFGTFTSTHFLINRNNFTGARLCTGQVIQAAVQYAITQGAPIALLPDVTTPVLNIPGTNDGTIQLSAGIRSLVYPPTDEVNSVKIAELIRKETRWVPDSVIWFDYSTSPPTFRMGRASDLTTVNLATTEDVSIDALHIVPRQDLTRPYVWIRGERIDTVNGVSGMVIDDNFYPNPIPTGLAGFGGLDATITLEGVNINTQTGSITTSLLPNFGDANATAQWLKGKVKWLADVSVSNIKVNGFTGSNTYPYELTAGIFASWMTNATGGRIQAANDTVTFNVDVTGANGDIIKSQQVQVPLTTLNFNTNGKAEEIEQVTGTPFPEFLASNLAQEIYDSINVLQYDGEITIKESECSFMADLGNRVNLSDFPQFASMNATIQAVEIDIDEGTTKLKIGPNPLLNVKDMVDLLRVFRSRVVEMSPNVQGSGTFSGASSTSIGDNVAKDMAGAGAGYKQTHVVSDSVTGAGNSIMLQSTPANTGVLQKVMGLVIQNNNDGLIAASYGDCIINGTKYPIRFRLYDVCVTDPTSGAQTVMQCVLFGSLPFAKT